MVNGRQMTVVWHIDNLKVSHVDATEAEKFVRQMEKTFGKDTPLTVSRGQVHDYLGMTLDFCTKGEVQIYMEHYNVARCTRRNERDGQYACGITLD